MRGGSLLRLAFLAALLGLVAAPVRADWLVTREGTWVETRGAWQVKGKLVVFHTLKGDLSSLRLADVDLEASRRETARAALARQTAEEARRQPTEKKRPPVFVLTDDKVRHAAAAGTAAGAVSAAPPSLSVASWERAAAAGDGHVVITGTLRNTSGVQASEIELAVQLLDAGGRTTASGQAVLTATALGAGEQSGFKVDIPGATPYAQVKFEPKAVFAAAVAAAPAPAAPAPAEGGSLAVSSWKRVDNAGGRGGVEIQGTLQNAANSLIVDAAVEVQLYNEAGERVATAPGVLSATTLQPGGATDFRARFPGVFAFSEVRFEPKGMPLDVGPAAPQPPA